MYSQSCTVTLLVLLCVYPHMLYCQENKVELMKEFLLHRNLKTAVLFICEREPCKLFHLDFITILNLKCLMTHGYIFCLFCDVIVLLIKLE